MIKYYSADGVEWELPDNFRAVIVGDTKGNVIFAKDADTTLGKIYTANQGVFSIESRDPIDNWSNNEKQSIDKKVRVVSTITFYLK